MGVTNAKKLSAVLSKWARPAISQIASGRAMQMPTMKSLQAAIIGSGIVGNGYMLENDIKPFIEPFIDSLIEPMLNQYVSNLPDDAIPSIARKVVDQMLQQECFTILDGLITFDSSDIMELDEMLKRNLPVEECESYEVI